MDFGKLLKESFETAYEKQVIGERWAKPNRKKLPEIIVKGRKYHYQKCNPSNSDFQSSYIIHGRNGARYGLFRSNESNKLFAVNMKNKKINRKIGMFRETDLGIEWISNSSDSKEIIGESIMCESNKSGKNVHLEHLEDRVIDLGSEGAKESIDFLNTIGASLAGSSDEPSNISVKWDGAPSLVCGTDPVTGKFFVGTKSVFNKKPKVNFTHEDIDMNHDGGLAEKLHIALDNLSKLGITNILQGDMLYQKSDLNTETIDGESVITFQPNTIVYAVPTDSDLAKRIANSNMGIVFHTTYEGDSTIQDMKANFGADLSNLNQVEEVWVDDATYKDVSGAATLTGPETQKLKIVVSKALSLAEKNSNFLDSISQRPEINSLLKIYNNTKVRQGQTIVDPTQHINGFVEFVRSRGQKSIDKLQPKTSRGVGSKRAKEKALADSINYIKSNVKPFSVMTQLIMLLTEGKNIIIKKLQQGEQLTKTFVRTETGYKATQPEGFVAVDRNGNAVKLVDRLEFSKQNFNATNSWKKDSEQPISEEQNGVPERKTEGLVPVILIVGRYQGFQRGHDSLVQEAKKYLDKVGAQKVAIGIVAGKDTTGDAKNPLTGAERIQFLQTVYKDDPKVVVVPTPFKMGHITQVIEPLAQNGMYIRGWFGGSDRKEYITDIEKLNQNPKWQIDSAGSLGFLPVDTKEDGTVDITPIIIQRDEKEDSVEAFEPPKCLTATRRTKKGKYYSENPEALQKVDATQKQLYKKIVSTPTPVIPTEMISGSIARNLIQHWNIPFEYWYKELVPSMYENSETKQAYKSLYDRMVSIMKPETKLNESPNIANLRGHLRNKLFAPMEEVTEDPAGKSEGWVKTNVKAGAKSLPGIARGAVKGAFAFVASVHPVLTAIFLPLEIVNERMREALADKTKSKEERIKAFRQAQEEAKKKALKRKEELDKIPQETVQAMNEFAKKSNIKKRYSLDDFYKVAKRLKYKNIETLSKLTSKLDALRKQLAKSKEKEEVEQKAVESFTEVVSNKANSVEDELDRIFTATVADYVRKKKDLFNFFDGITETIKKIKGEKYEVMPSDVTKMTGLTDEVKEWAKGKK